jgi:hypothetical protein
VGGYLAGERIYPAHADTYIARDIDARQLLHGLSAGPEDDSPEGFGASLVASLATQEVNPPHGVFALVLDRVDDFLVLGQDERIIFRLVLEVRQDSEGFVFVSMSDQPSRKQFSKTSSRNKVI